MATEADGACIGEGSEYGEGAAVGERFSRWREREAGQVLGGSSLDCLWYRLAMVIFFYVGF